MEEIKNDSELVTSVLLVMVDRVVYKQLFIACSIFLQYQLQLSPQVAEEFVVALKVLFAHENILDLQRNTETVRMIFVHVRRLIAFTLENLIENSTVFISRETEMLELLEQMIENWRKESFVDKMGADIKERRTAFNA